MNILYLSCPSSARFLCEIQTISKARQNMNINKHQILILESISICKHIFLLVYAILNTKKHSVK